MEKLFRDQWRPIRLARLAGGVVWLVVDEGNDQRVPWGGQWLCEPDSRSLDLDWLANPATAMFGRR